MSGGGPALTPTLFRPGAVAPGVWKGRTAMPCERPSLTHMRERGQGNLAAPRFPLPPLAARGRGRGATRGAEGGWGRAKRVWLIAGTLLVATLASTAHAGPMHHIALSSMATAAAPSHPAVDSADAAANRATANTARVRAAFDAWRAGTGGVFDLLHQDVVWTVAGSSPVSGAYRSKRDFLDRAVAPITARLATPIVPELEHLVAQGDTVVAVWRGTARTLDGGTYANHYAWHMVFDGDGRIVRVVAFLDTWALQALMD